MLRKKLHQTSDSARVHLTECGGNEAGEERTAGLQSGWNRTCRGAKETREDFGLPSPGPGRGYADLDYAPKGRESPPAALLSCGWWYAQLFLQLLPGVSGDHSLLSQEEPPEAQGPSRCPPRELGSPRAPPRSADLCASLDAHESMNGHRVQNAVWTVHVLPVRRPRPRPRLRLSLSVACTIPRFTRTHGCSSGLGWVWHDTEGVC